MIGFDRGDAPRGIFALQAFAAALVVADTAYGVVPGDAHATLLRLGPIDLSWLLPAPGNSGVEILFVLVGYAAGVAFATHRYRPDPRGWLEFWLDRAARIYPLLAFFLLFMVTIGALAAPTWQLTYGTAATLLVSPLPPQLGAYFPWLGHLWAVAMIVQYLIFAPLVALAARSLATRRFALEAAIAIVLAGGFAVRAHAWSALGVATLPWDAFIASWIVRLEQPLLANADLFVAGTCFAFVAHRGSAAIGRSDPRLFVAALGGFYVIGAIVTHGAVAVSAVSAASPWTAIWAVALPTAAALFSLAAIAGAERLDPERATTWPWAAAERLGCLAYGVYVWHYPIFARPLPFTRLADPLASYVLALVLTLTLSVAFAAVTHAALEVPWRRRVPTALGRAA